MMVKILYWQFKTCVMCEIFLKHFIFSSFVKEESENSIQKDFGHVVTRQRQGCQLSLIIREAPD